MAPGTVTAVPMRILAVHSSSPTLSVALCENGRIVDEIRLPPGREHLERLIPTIEALLGRLEIAPRDIDVFAGVVGPGSFSGIRVGLSTVKGLAAALGKPVTGVNSLEVLAHPHRENAPCLTVLDARRAQVYAALFTTTDNGPFMIRQPALIGVDEIELFLEGVPGPSIAVGDEIVHELAESVPLIKSSHTAVGTAGVAAELAYRRVRSRGVESVHDLVPLYLRRSDAEENKARGGSAGR